MNLPRRFCSPCMDKLPYLQSSFRMPIHTKQRRNAPRPVIASEPIGRAWQSTTWVTRSVRLPRLLRKLAMTIGIPTKIPNFSSLRGLARSNQRFWFPHTFDCHEAKASRNDNRRICPLQKKRGGGATCPKRAAQPAESREPSKRSHPTPTKS